jgi:hypothetical protein
MASSLAAGRQVALLYFLFATQQFNKPSVAFVHRHGAVNFAMQSLQPHVIQSRAKDGISNLVILTLSLSKGKDLMPPGRLLYPV